LGITDANGSYHFDNIETNGFYTVTPSHANYSFSPAQRSFGAFSLHTDAIFNASLANGGLNPLDTTEYYVRQQYLDFLNREPDESGFNFWVNNIESCGADANCREVKRINTSAAFFLSIEFQQTGYLVERIYKTAYGDASATSTFPSPHTLSVPIVRPNELLADAQRVGEAVVVGQGSWQAQLAQNKGSYAIEFVQRSRF